MFVYTACLCVLVEKGSGVCDSLFGAVKVLQDFKLACIRVCCQYLLIQSLSHH